MVKLPSKERYAVGDISKDYMEGSSGGIPVRGGSATGNRAG